MKVGKSKGHQEHTYVNKRNSLLKGAYLYGANAGVNTIEKNCELPHPNRGWGFVGRI
ncbi:MAG: hypothetical protein ACRDAS_04525 [Cetobacterium sp.]